jgi:hypothetical protein
MEWSAPCWSATAVAVALRTHREFDSLATPVKLPSSTCRTATLQTADSAAESCRTLQGRKMLLADCPSFLSL